MKRSILIGALCVSIFSCSNSQPAVPAEPVPDHTFHIYPQPQKQPGTGYDGWVGDMMPGFVNGQFELFFLHDAPDLVKMTSSGQHPIHKFTTKDLLNFDYSGEMIPYGSENTQDYLIGTGSTIQVGDTWYFYYTGHNGSPKWLRPDNGAPNTREAIMYATSKDLTKWAKKNDFVLKAPAGFASSDFRDPYVFYNDEFKEYWMLISTQKEGKGVIVVYRTANPATNNWSLRTTLPVEGDYLMLECADIFKAGDRYYMLFAEDWSGTPGTHYRVAKSTLGPWEKPAGGNDMFDGHQFYAGRTASNGTNRYAFGWVHRRKNEHDLGAKVWAGNLVSHEITVAQSGKLGVKAPESVKGYFNKSLNLIPDSKSAHVTSAPDRLVLNANSANAFATFPSVNGSTRITGRISLDNLKGSASFDFNTKGENSSYTIRLEPAASRIAAYNHGELVTQVPFDWQVGKDYSFNLIIDGSVCVLYLNDEVALTNRIYSMQGNAWSLAAKDLKLDVTALQVSYHQ